MPAFEFHPFLQSHEIPNNKKEASSTETVLSEPVKENIPSESVIKNLPHRPFDKPKAQPFHKMSFVSYKEISNPSTETNKQKASNDDFKEFGVFNVARQKVSLDNHPAFKENQRLHIEAEAKAKAEQNKRLFKSGNLEKIKNFLMDEKISDFEFAKEIEKTKQEYAVQLADANFLTTKHWKLLTGLRIFDKETFDHSIHTFELLKQTINELPVLEKEIIEEGVTTDQFLWAGLSHDAGKLAIPNFILGSKVTDHEWAIGLTMLEEDEKDEIFIKMYEDKGFSVPDTARDNPTELFQLLDEKRIRAAEYVPIKTILTPDQIQEMEKIGLDPNLPLKKVVEVHEKKSEEILKAMGFVMEGMLAGNHHNYLYLDKKLGEKPASLSALHIGIEISSTLIHLADVKQAMSVDRSYHTKHPNLKIFAYLVDDANKGKIMPRVTAIWIKNEIDKMSPGYLKEIRTMSAPHQDQKYLKQRNQELELIEDFLETYLPEKDESPAPSNNVLEKPSIENQSETEFDLAA